MNPRQDDSLQTRQSLLTRLRDREDAGSWQTFFDLYWSLLYNVARRAGLDDADAQDVVQDAVMAIAREMPRFRYDPERGSFKQWLFRILQRRIADHLRRLYRQPKVTGAASLALEQAGDAAPPQIGRTENDLTAAWEQEWERSVLQAAITSVRSSSNPKHFQVFDYCVLKEWPVAKVASTLGMNAAQVYLARHRISQAVKREARRINDERSRGRLT